MKSVIQKVVVDARMINMSGIGRYIQAITPALVQEFRNVVLMGKTQEIEQFSWHCTIQIIEFNFPIYSLSEQIGYLFKTPICDIFISPNYNVPIYLPQVKQIAVTIHDINHLVFKNSLSLLQLVYAKLFYKIAIRKSIVFTVSDFSKAEIVKYTKCNPPKIKVVKFAIDQKYFERLGRESETNGVPEVDKYKNVDYLLYAGNVKPHKNLKGALAAFGKLSLKYRDLKFLIVGKKDNFLNGDGHLIESVALDNDLKDRVEFTGYLSDKALVFLYKHAKMLLFPSFYEGFGLPPLEAMCLGCPVLVSREGSLPEICGNAAYYCDAYDYDDIANALEEVLTNQILRFQLIQNGYRKQASYKLSNFTEFFIDQLVNHK